MQDTIKNEFLFEEMTYAINGCVFEVYKKIGSGHLEKVYQRALAVSLKNKGFDVKEQVCCDVFMDGVSVGRGRIDFLINDTIILELKRGIYFSPADYAQLNQYLISMNKMLGIMIRFANDRALVKRVINTALVSKKSRNSVQKEMREG